MNEIIAAIDKIADMFDMIKTTLNDQGNTNQALIQVVSQQARYITSLENRVFDLEARIEKLEEPNA